MILIILNVLFFCITIRLSSIFSFNITSVLSDLSIILVTSFLVKAHFASFWQNAPATSFLEPRHIWFEQLIQYGAVGLSPISARLFPTQVLFANQTTSQHFPGCGCSHGLVVSNFRSTFWFAQTRYGPLHQGDTVDTKQGICSQRYASYCSSYRWFMSVSAHRNIIKIYTSTPKLILDCQLLRILRPREQDLRRG